MATGIDLLESLETLDIESVCSTSLELQKDNMLAINKEQLMEGKLATGGDIHPTYLQDPYFKSQEAAKRYSDWKDLITPNQKRKSGVPNLFITGMFHDSLKLTVQGDEYEYKSDFYAAPQIFSKFTGDIVGLNEEKREKLIETGLQGEFEKMIEDKTGLKF